MLTPLLSWILQIAIIATGIYLFLGFLQTTRGSGLLRGLLVAFLFGAIGLWGLSKYLEFEELNHIIEGFTPYVAVVLVIIFQPELRRAMARLGQQNRFAQIFTSGRKDVVSRVAKAATAMAARRHGALIAFQQETSLDAWTANAAHIDAEISQTLIESIFHPGAALHDGAVVIDGDRVVAAACLFPLSENIQLSKSTGTRHRAALGLTEESDAVTLIVSEETGSISIARQGFLNQDIPPAELEQNLRDALGLPSGDEDHAKKGSSWSTLRAGLKAFFTEDLSRKLSSLALATGLIYLAHQDIIVTRRWTMQVSEVAPGEQAEPQAGLFKVRLPEGSIHLVSPTSGSNVQVAVRGTQASLDRLGTPGGTFDVPQDVPEGAMDIPIAEIAWGQGSSELEFSWSSSRPPQLAVQRFSIHRMELRPDHVTVDTANLDPHFVVPEDAIGFAHDSVEIEGPRDVIDAIRAGSLNFQLEPIVVQSSDRGDRRDLLGLSQAMMDENVSLVGDERISVELRIEPAEVPLDEIEVDLVITNLRATSAARTDAWALSQADQKARFALHSAGLFDSSPGTRAFDETYQLIREYVTQNLRAYVDVSEMLEAENVVPVHWQFPTNWLEDLFPGREEEFAASARLEVELLSEATILLLPK